MPLISESVHKVMQEAKPTLVLLTNSDGRALSAFKSVLADFPRLNAIHKDLREEQNSADAAQLMSIIGVRESDAPVLVLLPFKVPQKGVIPKFKTTRLSKKAMRKFVEDGLAGKLEVYLKSEQASPDPRRAFEQVTLDNFDDTALAPGRYFLLGLHVVQQNIPQSMNALFQEVGQAVRDLGLQGSLGLGTCNIFQNEIAGKVEVSSIPQIVLLDKDDKAKRVLYDGKPEAGAIKQFLEQRTGLSIGSHEPSAEQLAEETQSKLRQMVSGEVDL